MVSQNWELRSATAQIVSDVSGLIIHKNERYWYNTDFEINCKQSELIEGRQIVRVIAHPMTISNFPSDFPDAAVLAKLTEILTELGQKFEASELPSDYPDAAVLLELAAIRTELEAKLEPGDEIALPEKGTITHISETSTADIVTCSSGHTLKVHAFFFYSSADITVELRFKGSGDVIGGLTVTGAVGMNLVGKKCPEGDDAEDIEIYLSGAGTVKGWINTEET